VSLALRDRFTDRAKERAAELADEPAFFYQEMSELVKSVHIGMAMLGKGGRAQMTPRDWGHVGQELRRQYQYLTKFALEAPDLSPAQVAARAGLYMEAATASYERANAAAAGAPDLPAYPGDGASCEGGTNCRCSWEIVETARGLECTWVANDDPATCDLCEQHAKDWNPLVVGGN